MSPGLMPELVSELKKFKILFFDVVSEYIVFVKMLLGPVIWLILLILNS